jgi:hypothetical protein
MIFVATSVGFGYVMVVASVIMPMEDPIGQGELG